MSTFNQLLTKGKRKKKIKKCKTPALQQNPQKRAVCLKIFTRKPKKPNSANRKLAKVKLSNKQKVTVYIPDNAPHSLQEFSIVLIRGGRVPDMPGVKYHIIRGKFDFKPYSKRRKRRSKYGNKKKLLV